MQSITETVGDLGVKGSAPIGDFCAQKIKIVGLHLKREYICNVEHMYIIPISLLNLESITIFLIFLFEISIYLYIHIYFCAY